MRRCLLPVLLCPLLAMAEEPSQPAGNATVVDTGNATAGNATVGDASESAEATPSPTPPPAAGISPGSMSLTPPAGPTLDTIAVQEDVISIGETPELSLPDDAMVEPNALVPDLPPEPPPAMNIAREGERQRELSVRYQQLRVRFEQDPAVVSLRQQADAATTIEDRRAALREYYRLLLKKIAAADKALAEKCRIMEDAYLRRLAQRRLEPTIPLSLPPTPQPLE